jgi:adenylate kinase family enzyme
MGAIIILSGPVGSGKTTIARELIALLPCEAVCATRTATRSTGAVADYAQFRDLYHDFDDAGTHALTDDNVPPAEMASAIIQGVREGRFLVR